MEYNQHNINFDDLANKLFCTFTVEQGLDDTLEEISSKYQILFNKIFVLYIQSTNDFGAEGIMRNYELMDLVTYCEDAVGSDNVKDIDKKIRDE